MSRSQRSWQLRPLLVGMATAALLFACKSGKAEDQPEEPATREDDAAPVAAVNPPRPLDPSFVPAGALADLQDMVLDAEPPCSLTIETLKPALDSIAEYQEQLATASDEASAVQLLQSLSGELSSRLPAIATRSESDELRRISAELNASLGDLAESLQLASEAILSNDKPASAATMRRIHNGVANTKSSVEGLIRQCAP